LSYLLPNRIIYHPLLLNIHPVCVTMMIVFEVSPYENSILPGHIRFDSLHSCVFTDALVVKFSPVATYVFPFEMKYKARANVYDR
jgi:hypothetical protein